MIEKYLIYNLQTARKRPKNAWVSWRFFQKFPTVFGFEKFYFTHCDIIIKWESIILNFLSFIRKPCFFLNWRVWGKNLVISGEINVFLSVKFLNLSVLLFLVPELKIITETCPYVPKSKSRVRDDPSYRMIKNIV